ncbi:hypothetical protein D3C87_2196410 [compost metagenome]
MENHLAAVVSLYKSLGGGWHSAQPRVDPVSRAQMQQRTDWGELLDEPAPTEHAQGETK